MRGRAGLGGDTLVCLDGVAPVKEKGCNPVGREGKLLQGLGGPLK